VCAETPILLFFTLRFLLFVLLYANTRVCDSYYCTKMYFDLEMKILIIVACA